MSKTSKVASPSLEQVLKVVANECKVEKGPDGLTPSWVSRAIAKAFGKPHQFRPTEFGGDTCTCGRDIREEVHHE